MPPQEGSSTRAVLAVEVGKSDRAEHARTLPSNIEQLLSPKG